MQRFRWMGLYVLVVAMALGCAVLAVAKMRAAVDLPTPARVGEHQESGEG